MKMGIANSSVSGRLCASGWGPVEANEGFDAIPC